jgi:transposase
MVHVGLDLCRTRLDVCVLAEDGVLLRTTTAPADRDGLGVLVRELAPPGSVSAAIESMNGARFVHDALELLGWDVEIADAQKVKGLAPLACKTDRIDARVLAELSRRDLVPAIWLPDPSVRAERERSRYRLHLTRHRTMFKNRIHATLIAFGKPCPVSDLFGASGRRLLASLEIPDPWHAAVKAALHHIDDLDAEIDACQKELAQLGADHKYVPLLTTLPGVSWVLAYTIASEIGDIARFSSPKKLCGYTALCPRVYQSGGSDHRGPLAKNGPKYLRWAFIEATIHASRHPAYKAH